MSTAALALLAAVAALAATVVVAAVVLRSRRTSDRLLTAGLLQMSEQMDALSRELAVTVERVREDADRARIVESLGPSLDLDEVLTRCAEAAASLHDVAGAAVAFVVDGQTLSATAGLGAVELGRASGSPGGAGAVGGPPDGRTVRAVGVSYRYQGGSEDGTAIQSGVAVPLHSETGSAGFLTVYGHAEAPPVAGRDFQTLEAIARHAGPAIEAAARRRGALRTPAGTDGLTGLGNRQVLHETLTLEVARAHRHGRLLALCVIDLDDFKRASSRIGHHAGDDLLVELAGLLRETIRPADIAFRSGADAFAVILPESRRVDAEAMFARLRARIGRPAFPGPVIGLSAGIAELKPDDDGVSLFARAERALHRAKEAGKGTAA